MSPSLLRAALVAVFLFSMGMSLFAQGQPRLQGRPGGGIWEDIEEATIKTRVSAATGAPPKRDIVPQAYRTLQLNRSALANLLATAPPEFSGPIKTKGTELQIPLPSGGFGRFRIQESPIMEPELAAQFPQIKTYVGQGIDDPTATMRIDFTPQGFHAIILSASGQIYIDPYSREADTNYISYFKRDFSAADKPFSCFVEAATEQNERFSLNATPSRPTGAALRTYRLALACTGEYAIKVCSPSAPTVAATLAAMVTSVNRCTGVYERELSIRFVLVSNNDQLIYLSGSTDPYTNSEGGTMLNENQANIDSIVGSANYDFGHVFSTGGGGIAGLGVICSASAKAWGVTGTSNPVGDPFDIDYVSHEIGHQFGANHTFNGTGDNCLNHRSASTAYEPGSGTTIMAYAGICAPQNLAAHSGDYFHTASYDEIDSHTANGGGSSCDQATATSNTAPIIGALSAHTIPSQTPFTLTASASDPDGDTLTYCWEEFDKGAAQDPTVEPRDNGSSPIFRSFPPTTNPTRTFPSLTYILSNANVPPPTSGGFATGEFLPTTSRTMTYRITVRDNRAGGGGSNYASTTVTSVNTAGPFVITAPNSATTFAGGSLQTVNWDVANTVLPPIICTNVKISLSTDGGKTFPFVLANSVLNIGTALVAIPNVATTQGRIKVEAVGNIFFDISNANFTITAVNPTPTPSATPTPTPTPQLTPTPTPSLMAGTPSSPSAESCPPSNGAADPGETVTVNFPIQNEGGSATTNLVATLQASGGVTPITTSQNYGAIAANSSATRAFQFKAAGTCGGNVTVTLQLQDGAKNYGTINYIIRLGVFGTTTTSLQNFDNVTPPALPSGWSAVVASGAMAPWATNNSSPDSAPNSVSASTVKTVSDNRLTSPFISIPSSSQQLSFRHRWNLEDGFDGGIFEISINGGAFTEIIAAGGSFVSGAYNGTISSGFGSPIGGSQAWTGNMNSGYTTTLLNLPPTAAGQNAQFRWRLASDDGHSAGGAIWRVDTINLISNYVCSICPSPPAITNGPPPSPVVVGTPYSFTFTATGHPTPTFSLISGTLPPGITLSSGGVLSGTATSAGSGSFPNITVRASNGNSPNAEQTFSLAAVTRAANYMNSYGLTGGNAGLLFDYDGDGNLNLTEYALQLNPTVASLAGLPIVSIANYGGTNYLSMTFTRSSVATDLTYIVQGSSDLATWSNLASSVAGAVTSGPGFVSETGPPPIITVKVRDTVPIESAPNAKRFIRLKVTSP